DGGLTASTATTAGDTLRATRSKRSPSRSTSVGTEVDCGCATAAAMNLDEINVAIAPPTSAQLPNSKSFSIRFIDGIPQQVKEQRACTISTWCVATCSNGQPCSPGARLLHQPNFSALVRP